MSTFLGPRASAIPTLIASLLLVALLAAMAVLAITGPDKGLIKLAIAGLMALWFAFCALAAAVQLVRPDRLTLSEEGFSHTGFLESGETIPWSEIASFHVLRHSNPKKSRVGWTYTVGSDGEGGAGEADILGGPWSISAEDLADLMQQRLEASRA